MVANWAVALQAPAVAEGWGAALQESCQGSRLWAPAAAEEAGQMPVPPAQAGCLPFHSCHHHLLLAPTAAAVALQACRRQARGLAMVMATARPAAKARP